MKEEITAENIVGRKVEDLSRKVSIAITKNDGVAMETTCDYQPERFRVEVKDGIIYQFNRMG